MNRSIVAAATAALMAGPLAAAGAAASLDGTVDESLDLTCKEARALTEETGDETYVELFCDTEPSPSPSPKESDSGTVTKTVEKTTTTVTDTVDGTTSGGSDGGSDGGGGGGGTTDEVLGTSDPDTTSAGEQPQGFTPTDNTRRQRARKQPAPVQPLGPLGFDANGPLAPGTRGHSSLTLQPFSSPTVGGGFVYELPQIAEQLFGGNEFAGAEDPMVAASATSATEASPYSSTGYTTTPADANGWLAATATGLIMLVGAGHALAGGRTPKRQRA